MTKPRSVVHVAQPAGDGVAHVVRDLALDQRDHGWRVTVVGPPGWLERQCAVHDIPWVRWDASRTPGRSVAVETSTLRSALRDLRPDLLHLHSSKAGLAGRLAAQGRIPTIFQPHAWSFLATPRSQRAAAIRWERLAARWTALLLCCSEDERVQGERVGVRVATRVVSNGVDLGRFRPEPAPAGADPWGFTPTGPVTLFVGRLCRQKGQEIAIRAWSEVRRRVPGAVLALVGDGGLDDLAGVRGPQIDGVVLLGRRHDTPDLYRAADLCLSSSRWEGLALALLEGMASGRSTVATDVAGARSSLIDGDHPRAGAVVPVDDPDQLARAVIQRLLDPALRREEGNAARARCVARFDITSTSQSVRDAYERVMRDANPESRRRHWAYGRRCA